MNFKSGWTRQAKDDRDYKFKVPLRIAAALPLSVDLSSGMGPLLDQGDLGSCGPNSADECITFDQKAEGLPVDQASRLFIYYNTRALMGPQYVNQDSGVDNRTMLKALNQYGFPAESLEPYDISKFTNKPAASVYSAAKQNAITNYAAITQSEADMKGALVARHTFIFGFDVYQSMLSDAVAKTGIVPMPKPGQTPVGGHDVTFVGYDDSTRMYKFRNHWTNSDGSPWGDGGYGYMPYDYAHNGNLSGDFWAINAVPGQIIVPPTPTPPPTPIPTPSNLQQQIDAVFAKLIAQAQAKGNYFAVAVLKMVQQLVDSYLSKNPLGVGVTVSPADLKVIVDQVFAAIEIVKPDWAPWLKIVNVVIDQLLSQVP